MGQAMAEPDGGKRRGCGIEGIGAAGEFQRHGDILERCHCRDQMKGLEDDADAGPAESRERVFAERGEVLPGDQDLARTRPLQARDDHHHCGFAGAGGPGHAHGFTTRDGKIQAAQDIDLAGGTRQLQVDVAQPDHRCVVCGGCRHAPAGSLSFSTGPRGAGRAAAPSCHAGASRGERRAPEDPGPRR